MTLCLHFVRIMEKDTDKVPFIPKNVFRTVKLINLVTNSNKGSFYKSALNEVQEFYLIY